MVWEEGEWALWEVLEEGEAVEEEAGGAGTVASSVGSRGTSQGHYCQTCISYTLAGQLLCVQYNEVLCTATTEASSSDIDIMMLHVLKCVLTFVYLTLAKPWIVNAC